MEENDVERKEMKKDAKADKKFFRLTIMLIAFAFIVVINNFALMAFSPGLGVTGLAFGGPGGGDYIITSVLNEDGRTAKLAAVPTISQIPKPPSTGDSTADGIASQIPKGTPFYAPEGISFDDPIPALKLWGQYEKSIQLDAEQDQRWKKLTSMLTCDFCCGSPSRITVSTNCGCAHAKAQRSLAKYFVAYYPEYSDEQIVGEIARWKAVWYPKPLVEYYLIYNGQMSPQNIRYGGSDGIRAQFA